MHYITITCNANIGALPIICITWENVMHYRASQLQISITPCLVGAEAMDIFDGFAFDNEDEKKDIIIIIINSLFIEGYTVS